MVGARARGIVSGGILVGMGSACARVVRRSFVVATGTHRIFPAWFACARVGMRVGAH